MMMIADGLTSHSPTSGSDMYRLLIALLCVSCVAATMPSPCPNLLAKLYECVDHVAFYQANSQQGDITTIKDCCGKFDVYTESKCFCPECQTGNDLVAHARAYGLELLQGFCAGMGHADQATPVASTLPAAGLAAAQAAITRPTIPPHLNTPQHETLVVATDPVGSVDAPTTVQQEEQQRQEEQREVELTMEFAGVTGMDSQDLSKALDNSLALLNTPAGISPHAVAHTNANGDVTVDVEYTVTGNNMGVVADNIREVMDTVRNTVINSPAVTAAQAEGRPIAVDVSVELKNTKTGQLSHTSRSMESTDDWSDVLNDSMKQHQQLGPVLSGGVYLAALDPRALMGGALPVALRTAEAQQVDASAMHKVGFEAADRVLNTLQRTLPNTTPMDPPTNEIIEGAEMDTIDREADMEVEVSMHSMPGVAQMAGLLKRALNDAVQFAAGNPWVMQAEQAARRLVPLQLSTTEQAPMALRPPLRKNTVSMPNTEEVEYEREMEITITASSTDSHEEQLNPMEDYAMDDMTMPNILLPTRSPNAPMLLGWLSARGSWLVEHYWDVLMVLSLVNLAGVVCMALRLCQLERARETPAAPMQASQFLTDVPVYRVQAAKGDLEAPLLASEHLLGY